MRKADNVSETKGISKLVLSRRKFLSNLFVFSAASQFKFSSDTLDVSKKHESKKNQLSIYDRDGFFLLNGWVLKIEDIEV